MGSKAQQIVEVLKKEKKSIHPLFAPTKGYKSFDFVFTWIVFFVSLTGTVILWGTDLYQTGILKILTFEEDGLVYLLWKKPDVDTVISIYPFNYTNIDRITTEKPHVEEIGPYVYRERVEKVNVVFNNNGTLTYQEQRSHKYDTNMSKGSLDDIIVTPNVPFLSAAASGAKAGLISQLGLAAVLKGLDTRPFLDVTALDYMMGFDDGFSSFARKISSILKGYSPPKFGLLNSRTGLSTERVTIGTGIPNLDELAVVSSYDGVTSLNYWATEECNKITGSDGTVFPGNQARDQSRLYIYAKPFCRRIPIQFYGENILVQNFPAKRFELPHNIFDNSSTNPENACYCTGVECPPRGTFSTSICSFDAPVLISFPHFLFGDPELTENVTGLSPVEEKHKFYLDIHRTLGVPVGGKTRFQVNVQVHHCPFLSQMDFIPNGTVLPIAWVEVAVGEMKGVLESFVYHATYTLEYLRIALSWLSLVLLLLSSGRLFVFFYY